MSGAMAHPPGKTLGALCRAVSLPCPIGAENVAIRGIAEDSRQAGAGVLFVAVPGARVDGHAFIRDAVANGCAAVVAKEDAKGEWPVPVVRTADTGRVLGLFAAALYDFPGNRMTMIGITGTNGKTTSSYLLESVIRAAGGEPGVIGTVAVRFRDRDAPAALTTPRPVELQDILWRMAEAGVTHVVMEVSSHALVQERINGLLFDVALFTNISRDHLDFHGSMEHYLQAKERLFADYLKKDGQGVIVLEAGRRDGDYESGWSERLVALLRRLDRGGLSCGIGHGDVRAERFRFDLQGISAEVVVPGDRMKVSSPLVGEFNLRNILGVIGCGLALGFAPAVIRRGIAMCHGVPGRLERVMEEDAGDDGQRPGASVFVDYAHTPDALEKVLVTLRQLEPKRLIVVFGCGGDRDRGKRPQMGRVAGRLADVALITSDNPRSEPPAAILAEIEGGAVLAGLQRVPAAQLMREHRQGYDVIEDRAEAIRIAVGGATRGDVVLISGKGHECYQIIGNRKLVFDDRRQARQELRRGAGKAA